MSTIYIVSLTYIKPLSDVDSMIPAHVEWLRQGYADGVFLASGRKIPRTGGIILAKSDSAEALETRLALDPFRKAGLTSTEVIPFEASMMNDALRAALQ